MDDVDQTARRQVRRGPVEIRNLVLRAAHDLFAEQGYHGTKTREIAERATVAEPVIFRNFGSKAELFEESILAPFSDFVTEWADSWRTEPLASADPFEITRTFVKGFYGLVLEHRELLRTLFAARVQGGDEALAEVAGRVVDQFAVNLSTMRSLLLDHGGARHWAGIDPPVTVAVAVGSVLSLVVLDDWVFVQGERRPGRDRQVEELAQLLLHGVAHRPAD